MYRMALGLWKYIFVEEVTYLIKCQVYYMKTATPPKKNNIKHYPMV